MDLAVDLAAAWVPASAVLWAAPSAAGLSRRRPVRACATRSASASRIIAAFEQGLVEMQDAYSREDVAKLWTLATPEMAGYIQEELNDNAARGVVNKLSNVRLNQGDLSEAWREGAADYATVAMRFGITDVMTDHATGRVVEGDPNKVEEATELWTFRRDQGGEWKVSAIQQA